VLRAVQPTTDARKWKATASLHIRLILCAVVLFAPMLLTGPDNLCGSAAKWLSLLRHRRPDRGGLCVRLRLSAGPASSHAALVCACFPAACGGPGRIVVVCVCRRATRRGFSYVLPTHPDQTCAGACTLKYALDPSNGTFLDPFSLSGKLLPSYNYTGQYQCHLCWLDGSQSRMSSGTPSLTGLSSVSGIIICAANSWRLPRSLWFVFA
jgi:hypothetical protein